MREVREIMSGSGFIVKSMLEAGFDFDIPENGDTFAENALIKARAVAEASGVLALADDSGIEIDFLGGEPGVYSARYMGYDTPYGVKNRRIVELMKDVPEERRGARFVCAIAAVFPDGRSIVEEASVEGIIANEPRGGSGFGYDPIFYVTEYGCTTAEMTTLQKNAISHRGKALKQMRRRLAHVLD
ncbi:MAG: RdgB/HAM1 family non-canonical purine NTP pyrophosphatase [Defluviitaleaceae bacterium]|nr:RdgB/HAM1 family non-canonical purine NTP pyrophosphatase [Defluviitaleaceae bacterium]MCL2836613.1 RdgB/HAM1 family non-canonical purine NTP pyrophosphatase [Defluviitaleaceae bacterium]